VWRINSCEPFAICTEIIKRIIEAIGKSKSVRPDGVSSKILKLGGEAIIPYLE
jgi:hypothetical protein